MFKKSSALFLIIFTVLMLVVPEPVFASVAADLFADNKVKGVVQFIFYLGAAATMLTMFGDFKEGNFDQLYKKGIGIAFLVAVAANYDTIISLIP